MAIIRVSSQAQLVSAIKNVRGGDTIALASGTYEGFSANNFSFSQKVTITSANPGAPAVINSFLLRGAGNVEFKNLKLDYNPSKSGDNPFWLEGARNVSLVDVDIEGHVASGFGKGVGLRIKNSNGVTLRDSEIAEFRNGIFASGSTNVDLINNDFRGMSNDGMLLAGMVDMLIQGNDFRNMKSPANVKHKDMIQFMTGSGEPGSRDIVIRDNVIENKEVSHGIFFTNSAYNSGNAGAFHRNILIEDNLIRSNQVHGISVNHGDGVTIRDNVVLQVAGGSNTPLINVSSSSRNVTIVGNEVASVPREQHSSWTVSGNDTGSKDRQHWYSDGSPPASSSRVAAASLAVAAEAEAVPEAGAGGAQAGDGGGGETVRVGGRMLGDGDARVVVEDLDFADGDVILFNNFGGGSFRHERGGNPVSVWNDGASFKADSLADLHEIADASPQVTATVRGEQLILEIERGDGVAEVVFAGLGDAFRAADPDLF